MFPTVLYLYPNGYSVRSYRYGVGKSTPRYTRGEPYLTCELPFVLHPRSNLADDWLMLVRDSLVVSLVAWETVRTGEAWGQARTRRSCAGLG